MAAKTLRKLSITRVALVPLGSNPEAEIMLFKSKHVPPQPGEKEFTDMKIDSTKYTKEERESLTALLAKGGVTVEPDGTGQEEILKGLAPEVLAIIEKAKTDAATATAAAADAVARANDAQATAALEKAARQETEFAQASVDLVKSYPGTADTSARLLFRVKKAVSAEDYTALETLIKAGGTALAAVVGKETGDSGAQNTGDAYAELKKKAQAVQKEEKMSFSKAFDKVCDENPDLVAQYREERAGSRQ